MWYKVLEQNTKPKKGNEMVCRSIVLPALLVGVLISAGCAPNGATPSAKVAVVNVTLNAGESITYRGLISPRFTPIRYPADVSVTNVADATDVCATAPNAPMLEVQPNVGSSTIICAMRGWTIPVTATPYPSNEGTDTGVILDAATGRQVGTYSMSWQGR